MVCTPLTLQPAHLLVQYIFIYTHTVYMNPQIVTFSLLSSLSSLFLPLSLYLFHTHKCTAIFKLLFSHGSLIGNTKRNYWYCLISLGSTVLEEPRSIWLAACMCAYVDQHVFVCVTIYVLECFLKIENWQLLTHILCVLWVSVSLWVNVKCWALHSLFDRWVGQFLATSPCLLNLPALAPQPPVTSCVVHVP